MKTDVRYCMSSYLQYRTVVDQQCRFSDTIVPWYYQGTKDRTPVNTAEDLDIQLRLQIGRALQKGKCALMLSSGMDSAILAGYLPEGTQTYTLHCLAKKGIDETKAAAAYAKANHLKHTVIDVSWRDFEENAVPLMKQKGYPIHSIEVQVLKAAQQAKKDGIDILIFGETADIIYGGHSKLLARDWMKEEFVERFSFVDPQKVLRNGMKIESPVEPYVMENNQVDVFGFLNGFEYDVSLGFYNNACRMGEIEFCAPYSHTFLGHKLDLSRIRNGEGKYVVRELYQRVYPDYDIPPKTPLPRPMEEWLAEWEGPKHPVFEKDIVGNLNGDQKWYVYALDQFMRYIVEE